MCKLSILCLLLLIGCTKENKCGLHTFSATTCEQDAKGDIWVVNERDTPDLYILSPEECEFHRKNLIKMTSGTYFLNGKQVNVKDLIFCECQ